MKCCKQLIDDLSLILFEPIPSQTSEGDKRSLLGIHSAVANRYENFTYLEIGSHLGGSIQPYLRDHRCKKIFSIDPRPQQQPDDRFPGHKSIYKDNSSERMLTLLKNAEIGDINKIVCIESDASVIEPSEIKPRPDILYIDGEHTMNAVISDCDFCLKVMSKSGTIIFHDYYIIHPAIMEICKQLRKKKQKHIALKLESNIFAIFFDKNVILNNPYLYILFKRNRFFIQKLVINNYFKSIFPESILNNFRKLRRTLLK